MKDAPTEEFLSVTPGIFMRNLSGLWHCEDGSPPTPCGDDRVRSSFSTSLVGDLSSSSFPTFVIGNPSSSSFPTSLVGNPGCLFFGWIPAPAKVLTGASSQACRYDKTGGIDARPCKGCRGKLYDCGHDDLGSPSRGKIFTELTVSVN